MDFNGLLLINKPIGWTSHDVVTKVRNLLSKQAGTKVKVGHTGTLDPRATGLLVLTIGSYCKKAAEYSKLDKTYEVSMILGKTSTTGDLEGEIMNVSDKRPSKKEVEEAINSFIGESKQTPPAYSAIKVNGVRAYKLARRGKTPNLEPRSITIYDISKSSYNYPNISFMVSVSSGTYVRSLVEDIGKQLRVGSYLSKLQRTKVGQFNLRDSKTIDNLKQNYKLAPFSLYI